MPIDSKHPQFKENEETWEMIEDFYAGEKAVKDHARKYVPALSGQTEAKYRAYINRGVFYNACSRTVDSLVGSAFRKEPAIKLPSQLEYLRTDATGNGSSLIEVAIKLCTEVMKTGRAGLLVDRPTDGGEVYFSIYDADDITNWNKTFFVLKEDELKPSEKDKYELEEVEVYRELTINDSGEYEVKLHRRIDDSDEFQVETLVPTKGGRRMTMIPFTTISPTDLDTDVGRSPIYDLVSVLKIHFGVACDRANAVHTVCVPTPWVSGVNNEDGSFTLELGPDSAILLPEGGKTGFLEFTGNGISSVEKYMERLESMVAALGARLNEPLGNKTLIETATGTRAREASAISILGAVVASVEAALNKALGWAADWEGVRGEAPEIKLNKELIGADIDANMLNSLIKSVQAGLMSFDTFYKNLEEAGLTDPGVSPKDEFDRIKNSIDLAKDLNSGNTNNAPPEQTPPPSV